MLRDEGIIMGRFKAGRLMQEQGLMSKQPGKHAYKNVQVERPDIPTLLDRQFDVEKPNQVWCGDITYIWTGSAWHYAAVVIDLHTRRVIGWNLSHRPDAELAARALDMAYELRGVKGVAFETALLRAPNMLFEIIQFERPSKPIVTKMPIQGPGMTHTCFQSPLVVSGYDKFVAAGISLISAGDEPVDIGGYGVTYAYGHDPEGNIIELEQLEGKLLISAGYENGAATMWMSQVALVTHNIDELMFFYQQLLGIPAKRRGHFFNSTKPDQIGGVKGIDLKAAWFQMNRYSKMIELMEYVYPATSARLRKQLPSDLGYTFSIEVEDIFAEYKRLQALGVQFLGPPVNFDGFIQVYANDIHGNLFSLRQVEPANEINSVKSLDEAFSARVRQ